ncbi:uncharacterized protein LOC117651693 [Thrips palmi]|uniref:Uncharacterized protein LOC117651693 n=1 Tax=Thrips palmi TaxID=161013 RepID=A0A6P9A3R9_THRPL|nr:uncharacterized protein LOC117651693 [Thrips palmi]
MKVPCAVALLVALAVCRESAAAPAVITTDADGTLNCDGMRCPPGDGLLCLVSTKMANGMATVQRQCVNGAGVVVAENVSTAPSPGIAFGQQTARALYKKN